MTMPSISSNALIVYTLFVLLLFFGYYLFYLNPAHILDYFRIPLIISYIVIIFSVLIFIESQITSGALDKSQVGELIYIFGRHFYHYGLVVGIILLLTLFSYVLYRGVVNTMLFSMNISLSFTVGLLVIILAIVSQYTRNATLENPALNLVKDLILYIPCLITDMIDFIKKDYEKTPSTVFILFIVLVLYCFTFFLIPVIQKMMYKADGLLLIDKPLYLNTPVVSMNREELGESIFNSRPFYDRWVQKILSRIYDIQNQTPNMTDVSGDISGNFSQDDLNDIVASSVYLVVPPDNITRSYYDNNKTENFTTVMNDDRQPVQGLMTSVGLIHDSILKTLSGKDQAIGDKIKELSSRPKDLKTYINSLIITHPELLSAYEKTMLIYNVARANRDALLSMPFGAPKDPLNKNLYHYGLTFWVYFNNSQKMYGRELILSFGSKPSLYYDYRTKELSVEIIDFSNGNKQGINKVLYKTDKVLLQRWNHIVMNYNYGQLDLFVNNNLVGTYTSVVPEMSTNELLIVGSRNNDNVGGICNMKYYETPLSASKIESIYKKFHNKNPPI